MGQSPLLREAHLLEPGLSMVRSLVGQSLLLREAQLFETGLSLIRSLMGHLSLLPMLICSRRAVLRSGVSDANRPLL